VDGVLFVPGPRVNLLSVSTLEDVEYDTLFKRGYAFIYSVSENPIRALLLGEWRSNMYIVKGQPMLVEYGCISESGSLLEIEGEREALDIEVAPSTQSSI
jgi:hypothetical protein